MKIIRLILSFILHLFLVGIRPISLFICEHLSSGHLSGEHLSGGHLSVRLTLMPNLSGDEITNLRKALKEQPTFKYYNSKSSCLMVIVHKGN